jgi:hypothetical protein
LAPAVMAARKEVWRGVGSPVGVRKREVAWSRSYWGGESEQTREEEGREKKTDFLLDPFKVEHPQTRTPEDDPVLVVLCLSDGCPLEGEAVEFPTASQGVSEHGEVLFRDLTVCEDEGSQVGKRGGDGV